MRLTHGATANARRYALVWADRMEVHTSGAGYGERDVPRTLAASTFPIKPEALIKKAKAVLAAEFGTGDGADPDALASANGPPSAMRSAAQVRQANIQKARARGPRGRLCPIGV